MTLLEKMTEARAALKSFAKAAELAHPQHGCAYVAGYLESAMAFAMADMDEETYTSELDKIQKCTIRLHEEVDISAVIR